jgi:hypothetical protein
MKFAVAFLSAILFGAVPLVVVQDTIYKADGTPFSGAVRITWDAHMLSDGTNIPSGVRSVDVRAGQFRVSLYPYGAYNATYLVNGAVIGRENWAIPASTAVLRIKDLRTIISSDANATSIQGVPVAPTAPTDGQLLVFSGAAGTYVPSNSAAASGGLGDPGANGLVKRTAANTTVAGTAGTDFYAPGHPISLSDILGLGGAATKNVGTVAGTVADGADSRFGNATKIQGTAIDTTAPSDGQMLAYSSSVGKYKPTTPSGGSGGASVTFIDQETPSGTMNGSNLVFNLATAPSPAMSLLLYRNGIALRQCPATVCDYYLSGSTITFTVAAIPQSGDSLMACYRY